MIAECTFFVSVRSGLGEDCSSIPDLCRVRLCEQQPQTGANQREPARPANLSETRGARFVDVLVGARLFGGDGEDFGEANVCRVVAVGLVDLVEALVTGLGKDDVDALWMMLVTDAETDRFQGSHIPRTVRRRG